MSKINLDQANKILSSYMDNKNLIKHSKAVAEAMRVYAVKFGEDEQKWQITGLLHDADWQKYPDKHPLQLIADLESQQIDPEIIHAIKAHGWGCGVANEQERFEEPKTIMAKALRAVDELTGFIVAVALMNPKQLSGISVDSVKKKMKDKGFARNVNREIIAQGAKDLGVELEDHIQTVLEAMLNIKEVLDLK